MFCHIDVDAFFASVLVRKDPRLKGKPLLALGMGGGCVIAASYEAKAKGVKTGMRLLDARTLCPGAAERLSDFTEACVASQQIEDLLRRESPVVEQMSVDEWFIPLAVLQGGIPNDVGRWALGIQEMITKATALTVSVGIAPTKTLAKMASEYRKPAGTTIVCPIANHTIASRHPWHSGYGITGNPAGRSRRHTTRKLSIAHSSTGVRPWPPAKAGDTSAVSELTIGDFLRDRPAAAVPGIGRKRTIHADEHGWKTAWDFAHAPEETVVHLFGRTGRELQQEICGVPVYPVEEDDRPPKSASRCRSFRATSDRSAVYAHLLEHLAYIVLKMRRQHLACRHLSVWLRDGTYKGNGANCRLPRPMNTEEELLPYARRCFETLWKPKEKQTQIGLALYDLVPSGAPQYSLFETAERRDRKESIQTALDTVHARFGRGALVRGSATAGNLRRKSTTPDEYGTVKSAF